MEEFVSGYCRKLDNARTVLVEEEEADCAYPGCIYIGECPIAQKIAALLNV